MPRADSLVERFAEAILDASPDAMLLVDADGRVTYASGRVTDMFGYDPDELSGEFVELLVPEHVGDPHVGQRDSYLSNPETRPMGAGLDLTARRKDGSEFPVDVSLSPIEIEGDLYVITVVRDLSEQEKLRTKYRTILEAVPDAIIVSDAATGEIVEVNEQATDLLECSSGDLVGEEQTMLHPSAETDRYRELFDRQMTRERRIFAQFSDGSDIQVETKAGERVPVEINAHVFEIDGRRLVTSVFRDVRTRKERERQLKALHDATRRLMAVDERSEVAEFVADASDTILGYGSTVVRFVTEGDRLCSVAVTEQARDDLGLRPDYPLGDENPVARACESGEPLLYDDVRDLDDDYDRGAARSAMYLPMGEHGVISVVDTTVAAFDPSDVELASILAANAETVLDRLTYERELERQNDRLDEFASVVSHDLRNPLNVAQGWTEMAQEECGNDHLDRVEGALDRMEAIIDDTLALAGLGQAVTDPRPISMTELAEDCWAMVETTGTQFEAVDEFVVYGDYDRLQHVLENLFRNAIDHGGDDVTVRVGRIDGDGFFLEDDGPGIPADLQGTVFEAGETTADDGTGFGLTIVRRVAEAHGWTVRATEGTDGGARFEFEGVDFG